jgi:hypothetical protein
MTWGLQLYFQMTEGVLQLVIAIKNPSPHLKLNPHPFGPVAITLTTTRLK